MSGFSQLEMSGSGHLEADMTWVGTVTMSAKELDRLEVLGRVAERRWTQRRAAETREHRRRRAGARPQ